MPMMELDADIFEEMRKRLGCMYISDILQLSVHRTLASLENLPRWAYDESARLAFIDYVRKGRIL